MRRLLAQLKLRFPRIAALARAVRPSYIGKQRRFNGKSEQEIFTSIYAENYWGNPESRSGGGSTLDATESLRSALPAVLKELGAKRILDAPCGDYNWMRHVDLGVDYTGGDIVADLVERLQKEFGSDHRSFIHLNLVSDTLPEVDVIFCRDCLQHLSVDLALQVLKNCRRSCRYLITSSFPDVQCNAGGFTGGMNTLNLLLPPFDLPEPMKIIPDRGTGVTYRRYMGVWSREQLEAALGSES